MLIEKAAEIAEIHHILEEGWLHPVFQPVVDFRSRTVLGYEALIRGPQNSPLHRPDALFAVARQSGLGLELEHACREASLRAFARLRLPGSLFLNVSPQCLLDFRMMHGETRDTLIELGIAPNRVVIELVENQRFGDLPGIVDALARYRGKGFQIAIDDLGEGFSNLRMWSELRPEYVKVDKHFINGIADDRIKYHFVRAMQDIAEVCNASLVAEGVERLEDFVCLRDMGIACAQGYFIAKPLPEPAHQLPPNVTQAFGQQRASMNTLSGGPGKLPTALNLLRAVEPLPIESCNDAAVARFEADPELDVLPVTSQGMPVGMINRHSLIDRFARPFRRELFGRKSCELFMDPAPLIVDQHASIQELAMMLSLAPKHYLLDGFIITGDGRYLGIGGAHDLMAMITEMQISAARYANPLTQLPGNVPINEHIDRMLASGRHFVAAYIDIDNFKPFNDTFGYRRGDDVIQTLGRLLNESVDEKLDFVGHIGGDDFFVIFQSDDWELRSWNLVRNFTDAMAAMLSVEERAQGGYLAENRKGELGFQLLPSLSVGAVKVAPGDCESHREVASAASAAKKQAKKRSRENLVDINQGAVFIERRRFGFGYQENPPMTARLLN